MHLSLHKQVVSRDDSWSFQDIEGYINKVLRGANHELRPSSNHSQRRSYATWLQKIHDCIKSYRVWHDRHRTAYEAKDVSDEWSDAIAQAKVYIV